MSPPSPRLTAAFTGTMARLARAWRQAADAAVAEYGLSEAKGWPVVYLSRFGDGLRQNALAEALGVEGPALVRTLDSLSEAGLIERREDPTDRRAKTVHLTREGRARADRLKVVIDTLRRQLFKDVREEDLEAALRVLSALGEALGRTDLVIRPEERP